MPQLAAAGGADVKPRDFDALIAHLGEIGVLDQEDLMLMHLMPLDERLPFLRDLAPAAVDRWLHPFVEGWT
jgi:hypothetical protein